MSTLIQHLLRPLSFAILVNAMTFGYGQGHLRMEMQRKLASLEVRSIPQLSIQSGKSGDRGFNKSLLAEPLGIAPKESKNFGYFELRFVPVKDQNVYLLYCYPLNAAKSTAEIGISMNNFQAMTLKYSQSFTIRGLRK